MAAYTPPLRDMAFVLHDVLEGRGAADPRLRRPRPRLHRRHPRGGRQDRPRRAGAAERHRRPRGLRAGERRRAHADRLPRRLRSPARRRLDRARLRSRITAARACPTCCTPPSARCTSAANMAFSMYSGPDPRRLLRDPRPRHRPRRRRTWLPKLVSCEWTGTMNLTEPHAGTDLGMLRTRAEPQADGSYRITGQKIFISAGDHDLAENIVHLVLARITGAPAGVKGISLFIVPEVPGQPRRQPRRPQRGLGRQARGEDGHPRQRHLRDRTTTARPAGCSGRRTPRPARRCSP